MVHLMSLAKIHRSTVNRTHFVYKRKELFWSSGHWCRYFVVAGSQWPLKWLKMETITQLQGLIKPKILNTKKQ